MQIELWRQIKESIYGPAFYREAAQRPFLYSLKYFFALAFLLAVIITAFLSAYLIPVAHSFLKDVNPKLVSAYPEGLVLTIKDHRAFVNQPEPYSITYSEGGQTASGTETGAPPKNLLVVDTKEPFTAEKFAGYRTLFLLTRDSVAYESESGIKIRSLTAVPDTVINKEFVTRHVSKLQSWLPFIGPIVVAVLLLFFLSTFAFSLLPLILGAAFVYLVARAQNMRISYRGAYQLSLHAATPALLFFAVRTALVPELAIPYAMTALFVITVLLNLGREPRASLPPAVPPEATHN